MTMSAYGLSLAQVGLRMEVMQLTVMPTSTTLLPPNLECKMVVTDTDFYLSIALINMGNIKI